MELKSIFRLLKKPRVLKLIQLFIGVIIILIFLINTDLERTGQILKEINIFFLVLSIFVALLGHMMTAFGLKFLIDVFGYNISLRYIIRSSTLSLALGSIGPGKMGEFTFPFFLKKKGIKLVDGFAISIIDKIISIIVMFIIGLAGTYFYFNIIFFAYVSLFIFSFIILFLLIYLSRRDIIYSLARIIFKNLPFYFEKLLNSLSILLHRPYNLFLNILITILRTIIMSISAMLLLLSFGSYVDLRLIIFITALLTWLTFLPFTLSGLGVKEVSGTYLYSFLAGIPDYLAINFMIISTIRGYFILFLFYLLNSSIISKESSPLTNSS